MKRMTQNMSGANKRLRGATQNRSLCPSVDFSSGDTTWARDIFKAVRANRPYSCSDNMERGWVTTLTLGNSGTSFNKPWRVANLSNLRTSTKYCEMVVVLNLCLVKRETKPSNST